MVPTRLHFERVDMHDRVRWSGVVHREPTIVARRRINTTGKFSSIPDEPRGLFGFLPLKDLLGVVTPAADTTDKPAGTTGCRADDVPGVESVDEGSKYGGSFMWTAVVFAPCEGENVQDREDNHLKADQKTVETDRDVAEGHVFGGFDDAGRGEEVEEDLWLVNTMP